MGLANEKISTLAVIVTTFTSFLMLIKICRPFNVLRGFMVGALASAFFIAIIFFKELFSLVNVDLTMLLIIGILMIFSVLNLILLSYVMEKLIVIEEGGIKLRRKKNK